MLTLLTHLNDPSQTRSLLETCLEKHTAAEEEEKLCPGALRKRELDRDLPFPVSLLSLLRCPNVSAGRGNKQSPMPKQHQKPQSFPWSELSVPRSRAGSLRCGRASRLLPAFLFQACPSCSCVLCSPPVPPCAPSAPSAVGPGSSAGGAKAPGVPRAVAAPRPSELPVAPALEGSVSLSCSWRISASRGFVVLFWCLFPLPALQVGFQIQTVHSLKKQSKNVHGWRLPASGVRVGDLASPSQYFRILGNVLWS